MTANQLIYWARRLWIPAFLLACAGFIALRADEVLTGFSWPRLHEPSFLVLAFGLQLVVWWLLVSAWQRLLSARLHVHIAVRPALRHFALFSLGKYLPGKVWGLLARASDMLRDGVSAHRSFDATIYEQLIVVHAAGLLAAALFALLFPSHLSLTVLALAVLSVLLGPSMYTFALRLMNAATSLLGRDIMGANPASLSIRLHFALFGRYTLAWLCHGLVLVTIHLAISSESGAITTGEVGLLVLANTIGILAGFVAFFAPAGLGAREAALAAVLATGVGLQDAIVLSVLMRLWTVLVDLILGASIFLRWSARE